MKKVNCSVTGLTKSAVKGLLVLLATVGMTSVGLSQSVLAQRSEPIDPLNDLRTRDNTSDPFSGTSGSQQGVFDLIHQMRFSNGTSIMDFSRQQQMNLGTEAEDFRNRQRQMLQQSQQREAVDELIVAPE